MYQYADRMLKHLPEKALKTIEKSYLYSKKPIYFIDVNIDRRIHNGDGITASTGSTAAQIANLKANNAKDLNIDDRIAKFKNVLKNQHVFRINLRYFIDLGKINFPTKIDYRIKFYLEKDMKKLFKSRKFLATGSAIPAPDAKNHIH